MACHGDGRRRNLLGRRYVLNARRGGGQLALDVGESRGAKEGIDVRESVTVAPLAVQRNT